jgi:hypothetical protein
MATVNFVAPLCRGRVDIGRPVTSFSHRVASTLYSTSLVQYRSTQ